jgi:hypothetical protein
MTSAKLLKDNASKTDEILAERIAASMMLSSKSASGS